MKAFLHSIRPNSHRQIILTTFILTCLPAGVIAIDRSQPPVNKYGAPVLDALGRRITYDQKTLEAMANASETEQHAKIPVAAKQNCPRGFVPATGSTQQPFWQYAVFGSGIGDSNIIIGPPPQSGRPEVLIGGNSKNNWGRDDFWQSLRYNPATGNYDTVFVSRIYEPRDGEVFVGISRIALGHVTSLSSQQIVVMLDDGLIYLYDFATKMELGFIDTGVGAYDTLYGLSLTDLDGDGLAELIVSTEDNLFIFSGSGQLLWQVPGAGGYDVVVGQMDNDPALEIVTSTSTSGTVVDADTHNVEWRPNGGFGYRLRLAPLSGENYQQLISAKNWQYVCSYDVGRELTRWCIDVAEDFVGAIDVADVDGDGVPEILAGQGQVGTVHVYDLNTQAEKWVAQGEFGYPGVNSIGVGDVDGDGAADLLWAAGYYDSGPDYLRVTSTTGAHDTKWQSVDLQGPFLGPQIGDLDGDGQPELVICSVTSESGAFSGRIIVFDLATLTLRGISQPVVSNNSYAGVRDLKLRDLDGSGRKQIVIGADYRYDGVIEIYRFDSDNTFTLIWTNTSRPRGSPFNRVDVANLDNLGTYTIIAANDVEDTGSDGVYVYFYEYPSGIESRSLNLASGFNAATGLVVEDLDGNGSKEIVVLVSTGDLFTFDGATRLLINLLQNTGGIALSDRASVSGLVLGDNTGAGHFLQFANLSYTQTFTRQLVSDCYPYSYPPCFNGISVTADGALWTGSRTVLNVRHAPSYDVVDWQSPEIGSSLGGFVATEARNGRNCVFSSARHAIVGLISEAPILIGAVSRKSHGVAGDFDISLPVEGAAGIECRSPGTDGTYILILSFDVALNSANASVTSGTGYVQGAPIISGTQMIITLAGVTNAQAITVTASNVFGTGGGPAGMANLTFKVLEGDTNGNGAVNASDVSQTKTRIGQAVTSANFRSDVNASGGINAGDVSLIKSNTGHGLP